MTRNTDNSTAGIGNKHIIQLPNSVTASNSADLWNKLLVTRSFTEVSAEQLVFCDQVGLSLLSYVQRHIDRFQLTGLSEDLTRTLATISCTSTDQLPSSQKENFIELVGQLTASLLHSGADNLRFLGQALCSFTYLLLHPAQLRWKEILDVSDEAGCKAIGIVSLIGFLMGIIIAFETALVAQIFGAVIFVVNGIGIAMTRELGPLMTAILFAGRSGSAFAAQLGTQKVNEELNALTTFGLNPIDFLVTPRLIASTMTVPLLSIIGTATGVIGGGIVMGLYDITFTQFYIQLIKSVTVTDIAFGIAKAAVFGFVIALIGCNYGLSTGAGAAAVGKSTTQAVVVSIVWLVIIDGVAALLSNQVGF